MTSDDRYEYIQALDPDIISTPGVAPHVRRNFAILLLLKYLLPNIQGLPPYVQKAIDILTPQRIVLSGRRGVDPMSAQERIKELFALRDSWQVDALVQRGIGVRNMQQLTRRALNQAKPEQRHWVEYDPENGTFNLLGVGPHMPEGYTGALPATGV